VLVDPVWPPTVTGQQTSLSSRSVRSQPAASASVVADSESQSSLRGFPALPSQSESVSESAFWRQETVVVEPLVVLPVTVVAQQTSLSSGSVRSHPAAMADWVSASESQSSFRGFPALFLQSESVSESAF
jgi:hypothetical protein